MWIRPLWSKMWSFCSWSGSPGHDVDLPGRAAGDAAELLEAAEVDGAGAQTILEDHIPLLTPYVFYNLIIGVIAALQIFEPVYVLYRDNQPWLLGLLDGVLPVPGDVSLQRDRLRLGLS
jgi:multiple sugar transport system permease protein